MIEVKTIQRLYNNLYKSLRNYIWDFNVVDDIAKLEIVCYEACPDIDDIKKALRNLERSTHEIIDADDVLSKNFNKLLDYVSEEDADNYCSPLANTLY